MVTDWACPPLDVEEEDGGQANRMHLFLGDGLPRMSSPIIRVAPLRSACPDTRSGAEEDADCQGLLTVLRQPPCEDHGRQPVRANNVAVEEEPWDKPNRHRPYSSLTRGESGQWPARGPMSPQASVTPRLPLRPESAGLCTARNMPVDHDGQPRIRRACNGNPWLVTSRVWTQISHRVHVTASPRQSREPPLGHVAHTYTLQ